jgi:hypothetical protein
MYWEVLIATFEVGHHFAIAVKKETMRDQIFGFSFVKNHCMLWKMKGKLIVKGKWCFKENKLSLENITNNKEGAQCHMCYAMEGLL